MTTKFSKFASQVFLLLFKQEDKINDYLCFFQSKQVPDNDTISYSFPVLSLALCIDYQGFTNLAAQYTQFFQQFQLNWQNTFLQ